MTHSRSFLATVFLTVSLSGVAGASHDRLRVFLDCDECEFDYLRREIAFIDYVRDRTEADVHILVTTQGTGSGGTEVALKFLGLGRFSGANDELKFSSQQTSTNDERRAAFARVLKLGLVRYVSSTSTAARLKLVYEEPDEPESGGALQNDPWNYWVFRTRANAAFDGEESSQDRNFSGSFSANRSVEGQFCGQPEVSVRTATH